MITSVEHVFTAVSVAALPSVEPSPKVNAAFRNLVALVLQSPALHKDPFMKPMTALLRSTCCRAEYALEAHHARHITASINPAAELRRFPYWNNYERLTALEWQCLKRSGSEPRHIVFLGSGPLPLTAILLADRYDCKVTLVDADTQAVSLSRQLIRALRLEDKMQVAQARAEDFAALADADVVYVAALVSDDDAHDAKLYAHLKKSMKQSAYLLVRSSYGSRQLLYRPVGAAIDQHFLRIAEVHPHDDIVNSILLFKPYA